MAKTTEISFIEENLDEIQDQTAHKTFLGREFMTWLWYFAEQNEGRFELELSDGVKKNAQLWLDDRIVLCSKTGRSHEHIIKGGVPSTSDEAGVSLRSGKAVKELKVAIEVDGLGQYSATLSGDEVTPKGLILPEPSEQSDQTVLEQRIASLTVFNRALDVLFGKFMDDRTSKLWDTAHINSIRNWIQSRNHDAAIIH
jgi:recombination associated protein RdgC